MSRDIRIDAINNFHEQLQEQAPGARIMLHSDIQAIIPNDILAKGIGVQLAIEIWLRKMNAISQPLLMAVEADGQVDVVIGGLTCEKYENDVIEKRLAALDVISAMYPEFTSQSCSCDSYIFAANGQWAPPQQLFSCSAPSREIAILKFIANTNLDFAKDPLTAIEMYDFPARQVEIALAHDLSKADLRVEIRNLYTEVERRVERLEADDPDGLTI